MDQIANETKNYKENLNEVIEGLTQIKVKHAGLESKHASLAADVEFQMKDENKITKDDVKKLYELGEAIKGTAKIIFSESSSMRRDFEATKGILDSEINRLRSENEMLLREYERLYENNRNTESTFKQFKEECKYLINDLKNNKSNPNGNDTFSRISNLDSNRLGKTFGVKPILKEIAWGFSKPIVCSTKTTCRRNIRVQKLLNNRLSSMSESLNNSRTDKFESADDNSDKIDKQKLEYLKLNRFKVEFE